jgi:purine-binding chemotaxis protein CheW
MATSGGTSEIARLLICRVGAKVCGLPLDRVLETMRPLPAEPLGQMASFVSGLALIRGRATPVVDARKLLGSSSEQPAARYVTLGTGEPTAPRIAALAVDAVLGVREVTADTLSSLPGLLREQQSEAVTALGTLDAELLVVLEGSRLLSEATWQALERELPR